MRPTSKYRNEPVKVGGRRFASKREAERYAELRYAELAGEIRNLECQPRFHLVVNAQRVCDYLADFSYLDAESRLVVEDVKSPATRKLPVYRLKVKLMRACWGIDVREVR